MSRISVMVDVKVEASFPNVQRYRWWKKESELEAMKHYEQALRDAVKEFNEFIRDHRSQDVIDLDVVPVHEDRCEYCGREWEGYFNYEEGLPDCCNQARAEAIADRTLAELAKKEQTA